MSVEYDKIANILSAQTRSIAQNSIGNIPLSLKLSGVTSSEVMYIEFSCPKGIKYVSKLIDIVSSGLVGYDIPLAITKNVGEVFAQLIFRDKVTGVEVAKSLISATPIFVVEKSINATDIIPDTVKQDLVSSVTASVNNMNGLRASILADKNAGAFNGAKGERGLKGDKGEQGVKGDRGDKGEAGSPLSALNAYPIGSIYQSVNATSPQVLFGGTWQRFGNGRVLVGVDENDPYFNAVQKVGGAKNTRLVLPMGWSSNAGGARAYWNDNSGLPLAPKCFGNSVLGGYYTVPFEGRIDGSTISTEVFPDVVQPYITVYMWVRVA